MENNTCQERNPVFSDSQWGGSLGAGRTYLRTRCLSPQWLILGVDKGGSGFHDKQKSALQNSLVILNLGFCLTNNNHSVYPVRDTQFTSLPPTLLFDAHYQPNIVDMK